MQDFIDAGADVISVHPESTLQLSAVLDRIQMAGVGAGVVLNPGTSIAAVGHVLDQCQVVVVMLVSVLLGSHSSSICIYTVIYCDINAIIYHHLESDLD